MGSSSFFVKLINNTYIFLNDLYEESFLNKIVKRIIKISKTSFIVNFFVKFLTKEKQPNPNESSFFINLINNILDFFYNIFFKVYNYFKKIGDFSFSVNLSKDIILPLKNIGYTVKAISIFGTEFFLIRLLGLTIFNRFNLKTILINGFFGLGFSLFSLIESSKLENIIKNNIIAKLIIWFFNNDLE